MKFQKLEAFEKHIKEAFPHHLSAVYVVVCSQESERKKILSSITQLLEKEADLKRCHQVKDALGHINGGSLFSGKSAAVLDSVELFLESEIQLLSRYVSSPNPQGQLILGSATGKVITSLYEKGKKEMVILDLTQEKPWEEKQRLQKWLVQTIHAQKKQIAPDAVEALFERLPSDRLYLSQEIEKLICYIGERSGITRADIDAICSSSIDYNFFQIAQQMVWGGLKSVPELNDVSTLLPLIGLLRNQLEMGLKMAVLTKKGATQEEISSAFPRLWPKALQQCVDGARHLGIGYFQRGLIHLFEFELGLKTSAGKPEVLFTILCSTVSNRVL
ncbi:MAG: hypothetical protein JSS30_07075 [Verrucomicrobia bacterium]|nr:hypothetical protein [Verrucomicrobiota bacterium]